MTVVDPRRQIGTHIEVIGIISKRIDPLESIIGKVLKINMACSVPGTAYATGLALASQSRY